jgi:hypothetical protein
LAFMHACVTTTQELQNLVDTTPIHHPGTDRDSETIDSALELDKKSDVVTEGPAEVSIEHFRAERVLPRVQYVDMLTSGVVASVSSVNNDIPLALESSACVILKVIPEETQVRGIPVEQWRGHVGGSVVDIIKETLVKEVPMAEEVQVPEGTIVYDADGFSFVSKGKFRVMFVRRTISPQSTSLAVISAPLPRVLYSTVVKRHAAVVKLADALPLYHRAATRPLAMPKRTGVISAYRRRG